MNIPSWELFQHGADIGVRGNGRDKVEAFEQAALALTSVITELERVDCRENVSIHCQAPNDEILFMDWLNALVFEMATRHMLFRRFQVKIESGKLEAVACGEKIDVKKHHPAVEVKGATLTHLFVGKFDNDHWRAECIVDV